jgi:hypothetical protein
VSRQFCPEMMYLKVLYILKVGSVCLDLKIWMESWGRKHTDT